MKFAPSLAAAFLLTLALPVSSQTIGEIQLKANAGDRDSQFVIGEAYRTGQGVSADREQAIAWFRKAAAQGDVRASDALGLLLFTKGERREAIPLLDSAARRGDARALYLLATARFNGDGVSKDLPRAYAEMRSAANKGLPQAIRSLQLMEPYVTVQDRMAADRIASGAAPAVIAALPPATMPARAPTPSPAPAFTPLRTTEVPPSTPPANSSVAPGDAPPPAPAAVPVASAPIQQIERPQITPSASAPATLPPRAPAPKPVATAIASSGKWRIQLGALTSQDKAEEQWRILSRKIPELSSVTHVIVQAGSIWRLQATGLASRADAQDLCKKVSSKGGACIALGPAS